MYDTNKEIRNRALWCNLSNLILPVGAVMTTALKGFLLVIQDNNPLTLSQEVIFLVFFLPTICVLFSWIFPFTIYRINRHQHPFVEESAKNALGFTLTVGFCLSLILPIISVEIALLIPKMPWDIDISLCLFIALLLFHGMAIILGSRRAASGKIYKYPFSFFNIKLAIVCSTIMIIVYACLSPFIIYLKANDSDMQKLHQIPFNSAQWQDRSLNKLDSHLREKMLHDLFRNYHPIGKSKTEILKILGNPVELTEDYQKKKALHYDLYYELSTFAELDASQTGYLGLKLDDKQEVSEYKVIDVYTGL